MSNTANWCDECKHHINNEYSTWDVCDLGHKPRFYKPQSMRQAINGDWGWKRKCEDFAQEKEMK